MDLVKRLARILILLPCGLGLTAPDRAVAFQYTTDQTVDILRKMIADQNDKTVCVPPGSTFKEVVGPLIEFIRAHHPDRTEAFTNQDMYEALASLNPCPFDASAQGAIEASADRIVGAWRLTPDSRILSPQVFKQDPYPVPCAAIDYFADGDVRTVVSNDPLPCPTVPVDALAAKHGTPGTIAWSYTPPNVLTITRSDEPGFIEVWNVYLVDQPFVARNVGFNHGDLLMYLVRYNDQRATTFRTLYFRHLERLAEPTPGSIR